MRRLHGGFCIVALSALLAGCENSSANPAGNASVEHPSRAVESGPGVAPTPQPAALEADPRPLTSSRTITRDDDADGVDDYRAVITETFDPAGILLSRTREQDFDADGIIDSRVTTTFDRRDWP